MSFVTVSIVQVKDVADRLGRQSVTKVLVYLTEGLYLVWERLWEDWDVNRQTGLGINGSKWY